MLVRDRLTGRDAWTRYAAGLLDLRTGSAADPVAADEWQDTVRCATKALKEELAALVQVERAEAAAASEAASAVAPIEVLTPVAEEDLEGASPGGASSEAVVTDSGEEQP